MSPRGWGGSVSRSSLLSAALLSSFTGTVAANPVASPFDYAIDIAIFNYPINGFILLALYISLVRRGAAAGHLGPNYLFMLFLTSTAIISLTGGMVDSAAYTSDSAAVYLVATVLIGMITALVAQRYLRLEFQASLVVGLVFFVVNIVSWTILDGGFIFDIVNMNCNVMWTVFMAFVIVLFLITRFPQGPSWTIAGGTASGGGGEVAHHIGQASDTTHYEVPRSRDGGLNLVVESFIISWFCLVFIVLSWWIGFM